MKKNSNSVIHPIKIYGIHPWLGLSYQKTAFFLRDFTISFLGISFYFLTGHRRRLIFFTFFQKWNLWLQRDKLLPSQIATQRELYDNARDVFYKAVRDKFPIGPLGDQACDNWIKNIIPIISVWRKNIGDINIKIGFYFN